MSDVSGEFSHAEQAAMWRQAVEAINEATASVYQELGAQALETTLGDITTEAEAFNARVTGEARAGISKLETELTAPYIGDQVEADLAAYPGLSDQAEAFLRSRFRPTQRPFPSSYYSGRTGPRNSSQSRPQEWRGHLNALPPDVLKSPLLRQNPCAEPNERFMWFKDFQEPPSHHPNEPDF